VCTFLPYNCVYYLDDEWLKLFSTEGILACVARRNAPHENFIVINYGLHSVGPK
jgi:hypothetical protein